MLQLHYYIYGKVVIILDDMGIELYHKPTLANVNQCKLTSTRS